MGYTNIYNFTINSGLTAVDGSLIEGQRSGARGHLKGSSSSNVHL